MYSIHASHLWACVTDFRWKLKLCNVLHSFHFGAVTRILTVQCVNIVISYRYQAGSVPPSDAIIAIIVSFPNPHCSYRFLSVADFCIRYRIYYCSEIGFYPLPFRPTFISENKESFSLQLKFIFSPHSVSFFLEFCRFTYFGFVHNTKCF